MWQHTMAQMMAEELDASMYIQVVKEIPITGEKWYPSNTAVAEEAVSALLPKELFWDSLPADHPHRMLCKNNNRTFYDRPKDQRKISTEERNELNIYIQRFMEDTDGDYCMVMMGYFQTVPPDINTAKTMWSGYANFPLSRVPDPLDLGIYIRCTSHYPLPSKFMQWRLDL
jgi:hypothetical protein